MLTVCFKFDFRAGFWAYHISSCFPCHFFRFSFRCKLTVGSHVCHVCGCCLKSPRGLKRHILTRHQRDKLKFQCSLCFERFYYNSQLEAHNITKHGCVSCNTCEVCGKSFSKKQGLTRHQTYHCKSDVMSSLQCSICNVTFKRRDSLADHIQVKHGFRQKFKCELCGLHFRYRSTFKRHNVKNHSYF